MAGSTTFSGRLRGAAVLLGAVLAACSGSTAGPGDATPTDLDLPDVAAEVAPDVAPEVADLPRELDAADLPDELDAAPADADEATPDEPGPGDEGPDGPDQPADDGPESAVDLGEEGPEQDADAAVEACLPCTAYGAAVTTGTIATPELTELSGLAASRVHPGVYYAHNDSGDYARLFAFDLDGKARGEFDLSPNPWAADDEDLAIGPCDAGSCLYLGDIGDNPVLRADYVVYVVPEPAALDAAAPVKVAWTALPFRYPDGSHNSETLLVHPQTGDIYLVTKDATTWGAYKFPTPHTPGVLAELVGVGVVPSTGLGVATGGDIHPCGRRVLLRSYTHLVELRPKAGKAFDEVFGILGTAVPVGVEGQGEAVAYDADGLGYVTVSEGAAAAIHHVICASSAP